MLYCVIYVATDPQGTQAEVGVVNGETKAEALFSAMDHFRKERNVPTNHHLTTKILFTSTDPEEADKLYNLLMEDIRAINRGIDN